MRVAIAGYGMEGRASLKYWQGLGDDITIVDESDSIADLPSGVPTILGIGAFDRLGGFDMVIRTASLRPDRIYTDGKKWSATNEFFAKSPAPIIGVTGTKGKGTTCSLIASILRAGGKTVHLVGNIGKPALEVLPRISPTDIVVYELSSFQLWDLESSPHTAVILPIELDHLDVHMSLDEYVDAKAQIARHQTVKDEIVYHESNQYSLQIANKSIASIRRKYPFDIGALANSLRIPGQHNRENASAAIAAVASYVSDIGAIKNGLAAFDGLPHRLKLVAEKGGVKFYDDSISTTPGSAIAAMASFDAPKAIILGGSDKGTSYDEVISKCAETSTKVVTLGQTGGVINQLCESRGVEAREAGDMDQAVRKAYELVGQGGIVILSPASASFDMFANYADRGDKFTAAAQAL